MAPVETKRIHSPTTNLRAIIYTFDRSLMHAPSGPVAKCLLIPSDRYSGSPFRVTLSSKYVNIMWRAKHENRMMCAKESEIAGLKREEREAMALLKGKGKGDLYLMDEDNNVEKGGISLKGVQDQWVMEGLTKSENPPKLRDILKPEGLSKSKRPKEDLEEPAEKPEKPAKLEERPNKLEESANDVAQKTENAQHNEVEKGDAAGVQKNENKSGKALNVEFKALFEGRQAQEKADTNGNGYRYNPNWREYWSDSE